ncbi:Nickel uptake substrate-specific transmembrane region [Bordetella ansorpii]|uniref:Nickel uptake substrate-specific transmembrane region n=1 Tax=Bordetella ansorpii TaxID=288768 RepID=A0A157SC18_9BORD|nr:cobalt ABC transporter substrate-binding protein [Bordetella ansorpii]SAI67456.1 Nickel uptake substrate-specific transmembrane region [Bordetella ansorpii]
MIKKTLISTLAAFGCLASAHAHQVWLEQPDGQDAVLRFGEFGDNLREASPGLLDKFGKPTATLITAKGAQSAEGKKTADGYALPFKAASGDAIVAEDAAYPLNTYKQGDRSITGWYHPAARYITGFTEQSPRLTLDIVPTGKPGELKVTYKGQPLPKAKVAWVVQSGWAKEGWTDEKGLVTFDMPWQGAYVAEVGHADRAGGERDGKKYDVVNYVTSLTYVKPDGAAAIPAGPAATPHK